MKAKRENNSNFIVFVTNWKLYAGLLCVALLISLVGAFTPQNSVLFSILVGVGSGGIVSVAVAWLIDFANCRQDRAKAKHHREILFRSLIRAFDTGVQPMIYLCLSLGDAVGSDSKRTWSEWITHAYELAEESEASLKDFCRNCQVFSADIAIRAEQVCAQFALLLENGIIAEKDIEAISLIESICGIFRTGRDGVSRDAESFHMYCQLINSALRYSPALGSVSEKMVSPFLIEKAKESLAKESPKET